MASPKKWPRELKPPGKNKAMTMREIPPRPQMPGPARHEDDEDSALQGEVRKLRLRVRGLERELDQESARRLEQRASYKFASVAHEHELVALRDAVARAEGQACLHKVHAELRERALLERYSAREAFTAFILSWARCELLRRRAKASRGKSPAAPRIPPRPVSLARKAPDTGDKQVDEASRARNELEALRVRSEQADRIQKDLEALRARARLDEKEIVRLRKALHMTKSTPGNQQPETDVFHSSEEQEEFIAAAKPDCKEAETLRSRARHAEKELLAMHAELSEVQARAAKDHARLIAQEKVIAAFQVSAHPVAPAKVGYEDGYEGELREELASARQENKDLRESLGLAEERLRRAEVRAEAADELARRTEHRRAQISAKSDFIKQEARAVFQALRQRDAHLSDLIDFMLDAT